MRSFHAKKAAALPPHSKTPGAGSDQLRGDLVGEEAAAFGQSDARAVVLEQSFGPQAGDQITPLGQSCRVDAGIHAQTESDFLRFPRGRGDDFFVAERTHPAWMART